MRRTLNVYSVGGVQVVTSEFYDWIMPECGIVLLGQFEVDVPDYDASQSFKTLSDAARMAWSRSKHGLRSRVVKSGGEWRVVSDLA